MAKENFPYQLFTVGEKYSRNDINQRLVNSQVSQQSGVSSFADSLVLFATLEKEGRPEEIQYKDFFICKNEFIERKKSTENNDLSIEKYFPLIKKGEYNFFWESQNPTGNYGTPQKPLLSKFLKGDLKGYLFARIEEKTKSKSNPFLYCGSIEPESYDDKANGERPFGVKFLCKDIPINLKNELKELLDWKPEDNNHINEAVELASLCLANEKVKIRHLEEAIINQERESLFPNKKEFMDIFFKKANQLSLNTSPYLFSKIFNKFGLDGHEYTLLIPRNIQDFITELLKNLEFQSILDPWMRIGSILYEISNKYQIKDIYGYGINDYDFKLASSFNKKAILKKEYFPKTKDLNKKFDLIVSAPPFLLKDPNRDLSDNKEININNKRLRFYAHKESEIIFSALRNLSDKGIAIFVVCPSFLFKRENRNIFEFIRDIGFSLEGIFHIPAGAFKPLTGIETRIIVIRKKKQSKYIFEGQLSFNKKRDKKLINNFHKLEAGTEPELGFLLDSKRNTSDLKQFILFEKMGAAFKDSKLETTYLDEISEEIFYASEETIKNENSIFIFLNGNNNVFEYAIDIDSQKLETGIRNKSIAQVIINPEKINKRVLVKILQSPRSKIAFNAFNSMFSTPGRTRISINALRGLFICIPEKNKQDELEKIDKELLDIKYQLSKFESNLWDKIDQPDKSKKEFNKIINKNRHKDELDIRSLPFPLASILQTVESFNGIPIKMTLHIEYFFEALSQFLAIYVMSGFYINEEEFNSIWKEVSNFLKERNQNISLSTFGTWNIIFSLLTKKIVQDIKEEESMKEGWLSRLAIENEEFLDVLTSKKLYGILMRAMKLRNMWRGHTGAIGDDNAKERYKIYNEMVKEVINLFGNFWIESPLVIPGENTYKDGKFNYYCQYAMGVTMPLKRKEYCLKQPLEDGMMHIVSPLSGKSCKLLPLIKFGESPNKDNNACYFFNRRDNKDHSQRWISYHNENKPERPFNDPGVNELLDKLSN